MDVCSWEHVWKNTLQRLGLELLKDRFTRFTKTSHLSGIYLHLDLLRFLPPPHYNGCDRKSICLDTNAHITMDNALTSVWTVTSFSLPWKFFADLQWLTVLSLLNKRMIVIEQLHLSGSQNNELTQWNGNQIWSSQVFFFLYGGKEKVALVWFTVLHMIGFTSLNRQDCKLTHSVQTQAHID